MLQTMKYIKIFAIDICRISMYDDDSGYIQFSYDVFFDSMALIL